ncbi:MAG: S-layer homology domain-containing protein [Bacillota bacterium]|nr:S-layer homology domain-containing protein [Bacillota bacterium]
MKKYILHVVATLIVLSCMVVQASATEFPDVKDNYYFAKAVNTLAKEGYLTGDNNGNFNPDAEITRAEFTALMCRFMGIEKYMKNSPAQVFTDVSGDFWANGYVELAVRNGIIDGYDDGTFRPSQSVTKEQAIKMIICAEGMGKEAMDKGGYPSGYKFIADKLGITKGLNIEENKNLKRKDAAVLIYNIVTMIEASKTQSSNSQSIADNKDLSHNENQTAGNLNSDAFILKQEEPDSCTACAATMLLRRIAALNGEDYSSITEQAVKDDESIWSDELGLYEEFEYNGHKISSLSINDVGDKAGYLADTISKHPEGIVIYDYDGCHALLLTGYSNSIFYVSDPAIGMGNLPIGETTTTAGSTAEEKIGQIDKIWLSVN